MAEQRCSLSLKAAADGTPVSAKHDADQEERRAPYNQCEARVPCAVPAQRVALIERIAIQGVI
jgi:hypothetical protein